MVKYFKRMPTQTRVKVSSDWDNLINKLESLPVKQHTLPKMRLETLPRMKVTENPQLPDEYEFVEEDEVPPLIGDVYQEDAVISVFENNVILGMDIIVYTRSKEKRPWCGRVIEILPEKHRFRIQWFGRRGKGLKFHALTNPDGSAYSTELDNSVVMFWEICESKQEGSFMLSHVWLNRIMEEYEKYDEDS